MKFVTTTIMTILLAGVSMHSAAAEDGLQVIDQGQDGEQRLYLVICPDGNRSSVNQTFNLDNGKATLTRVCIFPHTAAEECRPVWDLDAAAEASCQ